MVCNLGRHIQITTDRLSFFAGLNTTAGAKALEGRFPPRDATIAAKLRAAGAIFLGKANQSEWSYHRDDLMPNAYSERGGQCTSPYVKGGDPIGSSSGSAVCTAIGLAAASIGTETFGSIVSPSSRNNIVGIKPTVGLTSRAGGKVNSSLLEHF